MLKALAHWRKALLRDLMVVWLAARDARTPVVVRVIAVLVAAYALSPIDLIPDFIPVLGYLDDLLIVPVGIWMVLRWCPAPLLTELRARATDVTAKRSRLGLALVIAAWLVIGVALWVWLG